MADGSSVYIDVQITVGGTNIYNTSKRFSILSGTVAAGENNKQAYAIKKIVGGSMDGANIGAYFTPTDLSSTWITAGFAGSSVVLNASAYVDMLDGARPGYRVLGLVGTDGTTSGLAVSSLTVSGLSFEKYGDASLSYSVQSLYPGVGYNEGTKSDGTTSGYSAQVLRTGGENVNLQINRDGAAAESFKISLLASGNYAEDVINVGATDLKSEYIKAFFVSGAGTPDGPDLAPTQLTNFYDQISTFKGAGNLEGRTADNVAVEGINSRFNKPVEGATALTGGENGEEGATQLIGDSVEKTGIYALDDDTLNVSMAIVPGVATQTVQNTLITLAENSQNFLAVVAPPQGLATVQQAIDWSNGQSDERTAAITSNYAAIYWPWVQTYDNFQAKDRWFDPAIYAIRQMAYTDEVGDPWFAPAGVVRGRLTKPTEVEVSVNQGDRDSMYSGGNVINPIVNFPQQGIMIFGQRTAQRDPTALDRVNVRRLMIVVRKILLDSTRRFVFEPNDSVTWEKIVGVVDPLMDDIRRRRGLVDYKVICDETTNTSVRVDRNEMWCKVLIKPTKTAEVVVFELNLTNQSAKI